jgi:hypothetical protein
VVALGSVEADDGSEVEEAVGSALDGSLAPVGPVVPVGVPYWAELAELVSVAPLGGGVLPG